MSDHDNTRDYINDNLKHCREQCPNLVTVAASLLPFYHCFASIGYCVSDDDTQTLLYKIGNSFREPEIETVAEVTTDVVNVYERDRDDATVVYCQYELRIEGFWEYLRQLPRHVSNYGGYVIREDNLEFDNVIDNDDNLIDDDDAE